jgi:hypothetical protein
MTVTAPGRQPTGYLGFANRYQTPLTIGGIVGIVGGAVGAVVSFSASHPRLGMAGIGAAVLGVAAIASSVVGANSAPATMPDLTDNGRIQLADTATRAHVSVKQAQNTLDQVWLLNQRETRQMTDEATFAVAMAAVEGHATPQHAMDVLHEIERRDVSENLGLNGAAEIDLAVNTVRSDSTARQAAANVRASETTSP